LKDSIELEAKQNLRAEDQESAFVERNFELPFKFHDPEFAVPTSALGLTTTTPAYLSTCAIERPGRV